MMKKFLFIATIIAASCQLKAQQLSNKPSDPFLLKTPQGQTFQHFKLGDSTLFKNCLGLPKVQQLVAAIPSKLPDYNLLTGQTAVNIDHMPILKVSGNIDRMPIAKMNGNIDHMPIAKIGGGDMVQVVPLVRP